MHQRLTNDEAGLLGSGTGLYETTPDPSQFACAEDAAQVRRETDERLGAAIARAANLNFTTHVTTGADGRPSLTVCRWGMARDFSTIAGFEKWLASVDPKGVPQ